MTGLLLAGIGHINQHQKKNFLIVDGSRFFKCSYRSTFEADWPRRIETQTSVIESAFQDFTERKDVAILLINQHVCISQISKIPISDILTVNPFLDC